MLANVQGQRHAFGDRSLEAGIVDGAGAMRLGIDGYWLGNTDGIGDLYVQRSARPATPFLAVARRIGPERSPSLGPRRRAAAMRRGTMCRR